MINEVNHDAIEEVIEHHGSHCVSIFMPTHRVGKEQHQDGIRLKNLLKQARTKIENEAGASEADNVLQPIQELRLDGEFWRRRGEGLACFSMPGFLQAYRTPIVLPECVYVDTRFHIRPLLPLLQSDGANIFILALTQESARLLEATQYAIEEIELPEIRRLELEDDERSLQFHSYPSPAHGKGPSAEAIFHGQGGPADRSKKDALRFFQLVNSEVSRKLRGRRAPLVLACVGYLAPLYESANSYRHLVRGKVPGSPNRWREDELRGHAWRLLEPYFRREREKAWENYQKLKATDAASDDIQDIAATAQAGRIDTLFLVRGEERWEGPDERQNGFQSSDEEYSEVELLELAAVGTICNGGSIYVMDSLPGAASPAAATYRY